MTGHPFGHPSEDSFSCVLFPETMTRMPTSPLDRLQKLTYKNFPKCLKLFPFFVRNKNRIKMEKFSCFSTCKFFWQVDADESLLPAEQTFTRCIYYMALLRTFFPRSSVGHILQVFKVCADVVVVVDRRYTGT